MNRMPTLDIVLRSFIAVIVAITINACQKDLQQASSNHSVTVNSLAKVPLAFGPEFEFERQPSVSNAFPTRSLIYAQAVRKFSPHLDLVSTDQFPRPWLPGMEMHDQTNFYRAFEFNRDVAFKNAPAHWPKPNLAKIRTASMYGTKYDLALNPPTIEFVFPKNERLKLTYGVDDVLLEAHVNPLTIKQSELYRPIIDDLFFNIAEKAGILVPSYGGGHIHVDIRSIIMRTNPENFKDGVRLIRNFVVDFYKHNHFISYILRGDPQWAQTLGMTSSEDVDNFNQLIASIDGKIENARFKTIDKAVAFVRVEFEELNRLLPINLLQVEIEERLRIGGEFSTRKPALMFSPTHNTMEIRALHAQKNYSEYINLTKLFTGRLDFLAQDLSPIAPLAWDDLALLRKEFESRAVSPLTLNKIERQTSSYLNESLLFIDPSDRPTLKADLIKYFLENFENLSCSP